MSHRGSLGHGRPSLQRRRPSLEPRPRVLILCEGVVTEAEYFLDLRRQAECQLVEVRVDDRGGVPKTLVERAVEAKKAAVKEARRQRDDNLRYDEIWCVFDSDQHPNIPDACQQARAHGISLAISNPCFELWALLHFVDQTAYLQRHEARANLKKHLPAYDKRLPFAVVHPSYPEAVTRAQHLRRRRQDAQDKGGNPSTDVDLLTERIHELGRR